MRRLVVIVLAVAALVGGWAWWDVPPALSITKVRPWTGGPLFALVVGDDTRADGGCGCADAIHVVGVPESGGAAVLNIPRDTRVTYAGTTQRLNAVWRRGPDAMATAVEQLVGVPVHYVVSTRFDGFAGLVDDLGGVTVDLPTRLVDVNVGLDIGPGPVRLDGRQALAYARSRKAYATGDFARTEAQARLMIALLSQAQSLGPLDAAWYATALTRRAQVHGASGADLVRLAQLGLQASPGSVQSVTMPGSAKTISGQSYVIPSSSASTLFADFADGRVDGVIPPVDRSTIGGSTGGGTATTTAPAPAPATSPPTAPATSTLPPDTTAAPTSAPTTAATTAPTTAPTTAAPTTTRAPTTTTTDGGLAAPDVDSSDGPNRTAVLVASILGIGGAATAGWLVYAVTRNNRRAKGAGDVPLDG